MKQYKKKVKIKIVNNNLMNGIIELMNFLYHPYRWNINTATI
jgi:hypothetical protein